MKKNKRRSREVDDIPSSDAEIAQNIKMCSYYPLGNVDAVWTLLDSLYSRGSKRERKALGRVFDALSDYDDVMRKENGFR